MTSPAWTLFSVASPTTRSNWLGVRLRLQPEVRNNSINDFTLSG